MTKRIAFPLSAVLAVVLALPGVAQAELPERVSPLADAPAVRRRAELREKRFEIGASVISTVGQDFYHAIMVGGRLSIHLTDWIAIAATGAVNVTPKFETSFNSTLQEKLPPMRGTDRTPAKAEALLGMNKIGQMFAGQLELSPVSGKYSLFGKLFANYDFYGFGGVGVINYVADALPTPNHCTAVEGNSCPVTGIKVGPTFGVGIHTFLGDFFSLDVEFRDIMVRNNPAGRDATGDRLVNSDDESWRNNFMVGLNLTLFFPTDAHISD